MGLEQGNASTVIILASCLAMVLVTYAFLRLLQCLDGTVASVASGKGNRTAPQANNKTDVSEIIIGKYSLVTQICLCILTAEGVYGFYDLQLKKVSAVPYITVLGSDLQYSAVLLSVFAGCLVAACVMDMESCMIYNYVWWVGGIVGVLFLILGTGENLWQLGIFVMLQELFFCGMYGRADCHAFAVCAMVEAAFGMNMQAYLMQMLLAFGVLTVVQGMRRNIGRDGNLKQPVAFLPYIAVSFGTMMLLYTFLR